MCAWAYKSNYNIFYFTFIFLFNISIRAKLISKTIDSNRERNRAHAANIATFVQIGCSSSRALGDILMPLCIPSSILFLEGEETSPLCNRDSSFRPLSLSFSLSLFRSSRYASFGRRIQTTGYFNWIFWSKFFHFSSPLPTSLGLVRTLVSSFLSRFLEHAPNQPFRFLRFRASS